MMGLANRLCAPGKALSTAEALAREISRFPQRCMRSDRLSSYQQWHLSPHEALLNETRLGLEVIRSGETREGASRFSAGAGRHGDFENIQQD
jgi:enoyl-CoA hydratase